MNTADYLLQVGEDDSIALLADGVSYTYKELRHACARMAAELTAVGVQPRDRVGILAANSLFWVASYLAALKLRAVAVPLAITATPDQMHAMTEWVACKVLCADRRIHRRFAASLPYMPVVIEDDALQRPGRREWPQAESANTLDEDAALMFTSGTTARPRAVRVTHRNIQANTESIISYLELTRDERIAVVLPFFYCFGLSLLHTHLRIGASLALFNSLTYIETVLDLIEHAQCTGFAGVPSVFQTLLRNSTFPARKGMGLRKVQQAGGKLPPALLKELMALTPDAQIFVMYGQTEATARLSYLPPELLAAKMGSIGRGIPGVTLRVVGDDGRDVQPGEVGEIYAWGDNISPGYLNDPEATAERFVDGALRTGDMATVDDDGFITIVDRKSDFIKSYGFRVSSQEVEACVLDLPDVVAAAAIGEPDLVRGEAIKVFITRRDGSRISADDVIRHCSRKLSRHMIPSEVVIVDQLPMNAHGKIAKAALRSLSSATP